MKDPDRFVDGFRNQQSGPSAQWWPWSLSRGLGCCADEDEDDEKALACG